MLKKHDYEKDSIQEYLAYLVWSKQNTIFAKQTLAVVLSNVGSEECLSAYEGLLEEMYPIRVELKKIRGDIRQKELEDWLSRKEIFIGVDNGIRRIQI